MAINTKVEEWKKRLLDIGRTNKLINYKELRVGSITIDTPDYREIFNTLYTKNKVLEFIKKAEINNLEEKPLDEILEEGQVLTKKSDSELKKSLDNLRLRAKNSLEEQGVNILYLGMGFLEWIDRENKKTKSPILLFPVSIIQGNIFENNKLKLSGDEVVLNPALQLKFESEYNIILENPTEDDLLDIDKYFKDIEEIINNPMWEINMQVELGTFSFQKISMYKDFDELENETLNKVVAAVTGEEVEINSEEAVNSLEANIDNINPNEVFQVLDADSSQQEAILAAKKGLSFVMQGPPGTGKSQTITNIIAECLSMGKSVLFVSEKLAALNVVYNRLKQVGLDEFCLQLHSNKSNKKDIIKELAETLSMPSHNEKSNYTSTLNNLYNIRQDLNSYTKELHKIIEPFGKSLYEVYGMLSKYSEAKDLAFNYEYLEDFTEDKLNEYNNLITSYSSLYNIVSKFDKESIWKDYSLEEVDEVQIKCNIEETIFNLKKKSNIIEELKERFNLFIEDSIEAFNDLSKILEVVNDCDAFELQLVSINDLEDLLKILYEVRDKYNNVNELKPSINEKYNSKAYDFDYLDIVIDAKAKEQEYRSFVDKEKIKIKDRKELSELSDEKINFIVDFTREINDTIYLVNSTYNLNLSINVDELDSYGTLLKLIAKDCKVNEKWFDTSIITVIEKLILDYKSNCSKLDDLKNKLLNDFDKDILEISIKEILIRFRSEYSSGLKVFKPNYHKDVKLVKGFYKGSEKLTDQIIIKALELCKDIKEAEATISDFENKLEHYLDNEFISEYTDWDSIDNAISIMKEINSELKKLGEEDNKAIKNIILSSDKAQMLSKVIEKVDYILNNKIAFNSFLELIYDEENNVNNINSIMEPFKALIEYKVYFNATDTKLSEIVKNNEKIIYEELKNDLIYIKKIKELEYDIKEKEKLIPEMVFNNGYCYENISEIIESINKGILYKQNLDNVKNNKIDLSCLYKNIEFKKYISLNISNILDIRTKLNKNIIYINSLVNNTIYNLDKLNNNDFINWLDKQLHSISNIRVYKDYYRVKENINSFGVTSINIDELILSSSLEEVLKAVNKRFIGLWINYQSNKINVIRDFDKEVYNLKVKNFKVIDKEQFIIGKERLKHKLSIERPKGNVFGNKNNEVSLLLHEANKKRMHLPIRKLISTIPNLIFKIKPCFLMSPLAVSSFLDINKIKFDVVVFDEASQICPEDAIGSMLRSKQVIIVGDSEQLPPTSFFTTSVVSDDFNSDDSEELHESILDKCSSIMPTVNLKWHYRSRHEDLISFSNKSIYRNLITIPSSKQRTKDFGVEFIKVDNAYYERSGSRVNRKEAEVVANLVFDHFKRMPDKSLGIVTFSESQSTAIELAIRSLREQNQVFEEMFSEDKKEPFFIKNIESVQGDERDVIIFSIGYGKDINGNMSMNFGPLSRSGGYRRLNVAITRAKYNVKVVSSIEPSDIDLSRTNAEGVRMLRSYMEFAKSGYLHQEDEAIKSELNSTVEKSIYDLLINTGYKVDTYVGTSEYKINIAVKSPIDENKYILAIELDGYEYNSEPIARERYRLREELLYSMGWNFYRIWSTEWVRNREKVESELLSYLEEIISIEAKKEIAEEKVLVPYTIINNDLSEVIDVEAIIEINKEEIEEVSLVEEIYNENEENIDEESIKNTSYDLNNDLAENVTESNSRLEDTIESEDIEFDSELEYILDDYPESEEGNDNYILIKEESVLTEEKILTEDSTLDIKKEENEDKDSKDDFTNKDLLTTSDFNVLNNKNLTETIGFNKDSDKNVFEYNGFKESDIDDTTLGEEILRANKSINSSNIFDVKKNKIEAIVREEYPVHVKRVCEEILELDNLYKVTNSYKEEVLKFISKNISDIEIKDDEFLWLKDSKEVKLRSNLPYLIKIEHICKEEIALAIIKILQEEGPKKKDNLFNAVLSYFGDEVNNKLKQRYLINAIDLLFEEGEIALKHGEIKLRNYIKTSSEEDNEANIIDKTKKEEIIEENQEVIEDDEDLNEDFKIENIFSEAKFKSLRKFCHKNGIVYIDKLTDTHIEEFRWNTLLNRTVLFEINDIVKKYRRMKSDKGNITIEKKVVPKNVEIINNVSSKSLKKEIKQDSKIEEIDDTKIENVFKEDKFKEFREFCLANKIKKVTEVTHDDIMDFKWATPINRETLNEIVRRVERYSTEENKSNNAAIDDLKKSISKKYYKLSSKQLLVAKYIVNNIESIVDISTAVELGKILDVSSTTVTVALTVLNLGSFSSFKSRIKKIM